MIVHIIEVLAACALALGIFILGTEDKLGGE